jgi:hypothetical protein
LKPLTTPQLNAVMDKPDRVLATANVRFVPKRSGVRPVVNLSARPSQSRHSESTPVAAPSPLATTQTQGVPLSEPPLKRARTVESQPATIDAMASTKVATRPPTRLARPGPILSVNGALSGVHDVGVLCYGCAQHGFVEWWMGWVGFAGPSI